MTREPNYDEEYDEEAARDQLPKGGMPALLFWLFLATPILGYYFFREKWFGTGR